MEFKSLLTFYSLILTLCLAKPEDINMNNICSSSLSRQTFSCCFYSADLRGGEAGCRFSSVQEDSCFASQNWGLDEEDCKGIDFAYRQESGKEATCGGQKKVGNSNSNYTWHCLKPDPFPAQAEVRLEPEVNADNHVEVDQDQFQLTVIQANAWPKPRSYLVLESGAAEIKSKDPHTHHAADGLITETDKYLINLKADKAIIKINVVQDGLAYFDQIFKLTVENPKHNEDEGSNNNNVADSRHCHCFMLIALLFINCFGTSTTLLLK